MPSLRRRIIALGITPGVHVKLLRQAPLNGPWAIEVRGSIIALRAKELAQLELRNTCEES